jgi:hypothetical protein
MRSAGLSWEPALFNRLIANIQLTEQANAMPAWLWVGMGHVGRRVAPRSCSFFAEANRNLSGGFDKALRYWD